MYLFDEQYLIIITGTLWKYCTDLGTKKHVISHTYYYYYYYLYVVIIYI